MSIAAFDDYSRTLVENMTPRRDGYISVVTRGGWQVGPHVNEFREISQASVPLRSKDADR
jgi:hypothetical protein